MQRLKASIGFVLFALTSLTVRECDEMNQKEFIIAVADELKKSPASAKAQALKSTIRQGRQITIEEPPVGDQFSAPGVYSTAFVGKTARVIQIEEADAMNHDPGSWVISLSSKPSIVGVSGPSIRRGTNLVAEITFGAGGATQKAQIDASANIIALPANTVYVDIGQVPFCPSDQYTTVGPNAFYEEMTAVATAVRSFSNGDSIPTRSFWVLGDATDLHRIPIPAFAYEWTYMPAGSEVAAGSLPLDSANVIDAFGQTIDVPLPEVLESMARTHCFRALPPHAEGGEIQIDLQSGTYWGQLVFHIGL